MLLELVTPPGFLKPDWRLRGVADFGAGMAGKSSAIRFSCFQLRTPWSRRTRTGSGLTRVPLRASSVSVSRPLLEPLRRRRHGDGRRSGAATAARRDRMASDRQPQPGGGDSVIAGDAVRRREDPDSSDGGSPEWGMLNRQIVGKCTSHFDPETPEP